jgi:hypothetical protein
MTTKIYSRVDPSKLLHMIVREVPEGRTDLVEPDQFIQCAALRLPQYTSFKPHQHKWQPNEPGMHIAQEAWAVVKGMVRVIYYDTDGTWLCDTIISEGDASITLSGGHNYEILTAGSKVFEFKTGPYIDQEHDKTFL